MNALALHGKEGGRQKDRQKDRQQKGHDEGCRYLDAGENHHKAGDDDEDPGHAS